MTNLAGDDRKMGKYDYLIAQLDELIERFDRESKKHRIMYRGFRYFVFILTGISTVLASSSLTAPPEIHNALSLSIVVITAIVAIVTSIDGLRKPGELWVHEQTIRNQLKDIKRAMEFHFTENSDSRSVDAFFDLMQRALGGAEETWREKIAGRRIQITPKDTSVASDPHHDD
jgi:hypothetical protein